MTPRSVGGEPLLRWLLGLSVGIPIAIVLLEATIGGDFPYDFLGEIALLALWILTAARSALVSALAARRRAWRRCLVTAILPVALLLTSAHLITIGRALDETGDVARFVAMRPYYDRVIAERTTSRRPTIVEFDWGGMVGMSKSLVYDDSDQLPLPKDRRSAAWFVRARGTTLECDGFGSRALGGHYYIVSFPC